RGKATANSFACRASAAGSSAVGQTPRKATLRGAYARASSLSSGGEPVETGEANEGKTATAASRPARARAGRGLPSSPVSRRAPTFWPTLAGVAVGPAWAGPKPIRDAAVRSRRGRGREYMAETPSTGQSRHATPESGRQPVPDDGPQGFPRHV